MNYIVNILESQNKRIEAMQGNWGLSQVTKLSNILEDKGIYITDSVWNLLLYNVQNLQLVFL